MTIFQRAQSAAALAKDPYAEQPAVRAVHALKSQMRDINMPAVTGNSFSVESYADVVGNNPTKSHQLESIVAATVDNTFGSGTWSGKLTQAQRDAAMLISSVRNSARAYVDAFRNVAVPQVQSVAGFATEVYRAPVAGAAGAQFDYGSTVPDSIRQLSNEVFDDRSLDMTVALSTVANMLAARQTEAAEALFPTYVLPPDQTGFSMSVERSLVFSEIYHDPQNSALDFYDRRKNLLEAYIVPEILGDKSHEIVPYFIIGDSANNASFVATTMVTPVDVTVHGETFKTSYYRTDTRLDLLGLGQNPAVMKTGQANTTESLDHRLVLKDLLLEIQSSGETSYVNVSTELHVGSQFYPAVEGQQRQMTLNFRVKDIVLSAATLDVNGVPAAALAGLSANQRMYLSVAVSGDAGLDAGIVTVAPTKPQITAVGELTGTGSSAVLTAAGTATLNTVKNLFTSISIVGYKLKALRSNVARRDVGIMATSERIKEIHIIPLGAPQTVRTPAIDINTSSDLNTLGTMVQVRNTLQAWAQLRDFERQLASTADSLKKNLPLPSLRAIGRYYLHRPWYERQSVNLSQRVVSQNSTNRIEDTQNTLINTMRDMVLRGYYATNLQAVMDALNASAGNKPEVTAVGNPVLISYLLRTGDTRTLGEEFKLNVHSDVNPMFIEYDDEGKAVYPLYFMFTLPGEKEPHPINSGNMIFLPDMITDLQVTRDGSTFRETTFMPRTLHINHCPIMFRVDVYGLSAVVAEQLPYPMAVV